jgi:hypothetical protein
VCPHIKLEQIGERERYIYIYIYIYAKSIWCRVHYHDSTRRRFPNDEKIERR